MKIAIVAAMQEELALFRERFPSTFYWKKGKMTIEKASEQVYLIESGIGKANAAASAALLCEKIQPDLIINTGTTGTFDHNRQLGDVIYSDSFVYSDVDATGFGYALGQVPQMPKDYPVEKAIYEQIQAVFDTSILNIFPGLIVTADSFMSNPELVAQIRNNFPDAVASDMESCAIAQIAFAYDIPVINIRGISDFVGMDAPDTFDETVDFASKKAFKAVELVLNKFLED